MKMRLIAAAVLLPLLLVLLLALPVLVTVLVAGIVCALATYELLWVTQLVKDVRLVSYTALIAFLVPLWIFYGMSNVAAALGMFIFVAALFVELLVGKGAVSFEKIALCFTAGIIVPLLLCSLVRIMMGEEGRAYVLLPFLLAFTSDSGAYFAGRFLGKHKLAPTISPNKTIEGVAGGVVGAVVGIMIYGVILDLFFRFDVNYLFALSYGILGSLAAVFGDLVFSAIKRQTGIKDYGHLIPGHGGILDRLDSMTVVAPLTEVLLLLIPFAVR